jgi:hypothetical protein
MLEVFDFFQLLLITKTIGISRTVHGRENVPDDGSKIENRLVIIFTIRFFLGGALFVWSFLFLLCVLCCF